MQHVTPQPTAGSGSLPHTSVLQASSFRCQRNQVLIKQWLGSFPAGFDNSLSRPKHLFWKEAFVGTAPWPSHSALKSAVTLKYMNNVYTLRIHQLYAGKQIATAPTQLSPKPCSSGPLKLLGFDGLNPHTSATACGLVQPSFQYPSTARVLGVLPRAQALGGISCLMLAKFFLMQHLIHSNVHTTVWVTESKHSNAHSHVRYAIS